MGILFSSPQAEYKVIKDAWLEEVEKICIKGQFVGGQAVSKFEKRFSKYVGTDFAIGVGNGTDALFLALKALGIGHGDEVITVANTFIATVEAIHHTGATPVLVDCAPHTYLINLEQVKQKVTEHTKAIILVHLYGQMVDAEDFIEWAHAREISIIEDTAQAVGAERHGKKAGSLGDVGCFSFYPSKNLGALGDGGCIVTNNPDLAKHINLLRNHGSEQIYNHQIPGFNSRLDAIHAIALNEKLLYLDQWTEKRRFIVSLYEKNLSEVEEVILPHHERDGSHVFHVYPIRVHNEIRDSLKKHLMKRGILTAVHYPQPVHLSEAFRHLPYTDGSFPFSEQYSQEILSLPMHIDLTEEDIVTISEAIKEAVKKVTT